MSFRAGSSRIILCALVSGSMLRPCNFRDLSEREEKRRVYRGGFPQRCTLIPIFPLCSSLFLSRQKRSHRKCYRIWSLWRPLDFNDFNSWRGETIEFTRLPERYGNHVVTLLWRIRAAAAVTLAIPISHLTQIPKRARHPFPYTAPIHVEIYDVCRL